MKNKRNANDTQRGNTLPIPDIDIIDLENDGAAEAGMGKGEKYAFMLLHSCLRKRTGVGK